MDTQTKLPQNPQAQKLPSRPSHQRAFEDMEKWATSPGLQPPK
jgi:hypothetical protein